MSADPPRVSGYACASTDPTHERDHATIEDLATSLAFWKEARSEDISLDLAHLTSENERLRAALWAIKVDPHGHPARKNNLPVEDSDCSVCSTIRNTLEPPSPSAASDGASRSLLERDT